MDELYEGEFPLMDMNTNKERLVEAVRNICASGVTMTAYLPPRSGDQSSPSITVRGTREQLLRWLEWYNRDRNHYCTEETYVARLEEGGIDRIWAMYLDHPLERVA